MREERKVPYGVSEITEIANSQGKKRGVEKLKKSFHNRLSDLSSKKQ